jgi:hypothetical protein
MQQPRIVPSKVQRTVSWIKKTVSWVFHFVIKVLKFLGELLLAVLTLGYRPYCKYLERQNRILRADAIKAQETLKSAETVMEQLRSTIGGLRSNVSTYEKEIEDIACKKNLEEHKKKEELDSKNAEIEALKAKLKASVERLPIKPEADVSHVAESLVPIPPKYQRRADDPDKISGEFRREDSAYAQNFNGITTFAELIRKMVSVTYDELVASSYPANPKGDTIFNSSNDLQYDEMRLEALINRGIYTLIDGAELSPDECVENIVFNDKGLSINSSKPEFVISKLSNGSYELKVHYNNINPWTPSQSLYNPEGIDPVSIKLILHRLREYPKAKRALELLLCSNIIHDTNPNLLAARKLIEQDNEMGQLVYTAYQLICAMTTPIFQKYANKEKVILPSLQEKKHDNSELPEINKLRSKPISRQISDPTHEPVYVPWQPQIKLANHKELKVRFDGMKKSFSRLSTEISKEMYVGELPSTLAPEKDNRGKDALMELSHAFYISHPSLQGQDCLLSALATFFVTNQESLKVDIVVQIKRAMHEYLLNNKDMFANRIETFTKMDIHSYLEWLMDKATRPEALDMTTIDIELFAQTFGIQVYLFVPGARVKRSQQGKYIPQNVESYSFGPKTKECLNLFLRPGLSFFALLPRIDCAIMPETNPSLYDEVWFDLESFWQELDLQARVIIN